MGSLIQTSALVVFGLASLPLGMMLVMLREGRNEFYGQYNVVNREYASVFL